MEQWQSDSSAKTAETDRQSAWDAVYRLLSIVIGSALIAAGCYLAYKSLAELLGFYQQPEDSLFFSAVIEKFSDATLFAFGESQFTLSPAGAQLLSWVLFFLVVIVFLICAMGLIRSGVRVFSPVTNHQFALLRYKVAALQTSVAKTSSRLNSSVGRNNND